jgi:hypothetical protein
VFVNAWHDSDALHDALLDRLTDDAQSAESPILFRSCPHCGHETQFSDKKNGHPKSGIPFRALI